MLLQVAPFDILHDEVSACLSSLVDVVGADDIADGRAAAAALGLAIEAGQVGRVVDARFGSTLIATRRCIITCSAR